MSLIFFTTPCFDFISFCVVYNFKFILDFLQCTVYALMRRSHLVRETAKALVYFYLFFVFGIKGHIFLLCMLTQRLTYLRQHIAKRRPLDFKTSFWSCYCLIYGDKSFDISVANPSEMTWKIYKTVCLNKVSNNLSQTTVMEKAC